MTHLEPVLGRGERALTLTCFATLSSIKTTLSSSSTVSRKKKNSMETSNPTAHLSERGLAQVTLWRDLQPMALTQAPLSMKSMKRCMNINRCPLTETQPRIRLKSNSHPINLVTITQKVPITIRKNKKRTITLTIEGLRGLMTLRTTAIYHPRKCLIKSDGSYT